MAIKDRLGLSHFTPLLDFKKIHAAIENSPDIGKWLTNADIELVRVCLWAAMEKWLARDIYEFSNIKTEGEFSFTLGGPSGIRGYIDLSGELRGTCAPFSNFCNETFVLDWKTKETTLTQDWRQKQIDSWQWPLYAAHTGASIAIYRGVSWAGNGSLDTDFLKEIIIQVPATNEEEVKEHYGAITSEREHLISIGATVWPRNKPFACNAFGRECPYYGDCYEYSMVRGVPNSKVLSYSSASDFMLCQERSRRHTLDEENRIEERSWATEMGSAFHRGVEELYRQVVENDLYSVVREKK